MSVNKNLLKQFVDYLLNFYVLTALAKKQIADDSITVRQLFIDSCDSSQICRPISDAFYIWAGLSSDEITHVLTDYYTPSHRLAAFITLRSTMIRTNANDVENLAQQALSKWKSDTSHELSEADQYLSLDPSVLDRIVDDTVNEWSAKSYFNGYFGEAATERNTMINYLLDQKPQQTIEALVKSLYPTIIDCYLDTVKQTTADKLDNRLEQQHEQEIDQEFMQKLRQSQIYNPKDYRQRQFIDELSVHQKESFLNEDNFNTAITEAITTGVAILTANAVMNSSDHQSHWHQSSASPHSGSNDDSSWFNDDDDSFWDDDDDDSSSSSDNDDFFGGGDFFGGDGGFSGGGGGTASW